MLVLASPDGALRGRPFTLGLDIGRNVVTLKQQQIALNNMVVSMGPNRLTVDGVVREGSSHVDLSMLTGESMPVARTVGDAGSVK